MKTLLFSILFLFNLNYYDNPSKSNIVTITIVDKNTNEVLTGVFNKESKNYTDISGNLSVKVGSPVDLNLISYENVKLYNIKNDTIIKMNPTLP
jgi:hypothetical protein